jgi:hypothetical protein
MYARRHVKQSRKIQPSHAFFNALATDGDVAGWLPLLAQTQAGIEAVGHA